MSSMSGPVTIAPFPNPQQALAEQLLNCLGRDAAVHVCQMNGWDGVLHILRNETESKQPSRS